MLRPSPTTARKNRHVALYAGYISSDLLYRRSQLRITAPRYEDVRAFVHKLLRRRKADAAIATRNECNFSFKLTHVFLLCLLASPPSRAISTFLIVMISP